MKLIITEKPSVAVEFSKVLNCSKNDGYFSNNEYLITFGFGHLYTFDDSEFKSGKWVIDNLPLFPKSFDLKVVEQDYIIKQANIIKSLIPKIDTVIIATDAGREGELIAREILIMSGWQDFSKNSFRFWVSGPLNEKSITDGINNMKPASYYDSLYYSALARQQSDWIAGINLTRYTTCKINSGNVWSAGRVQSPTLNLIVTRENEITNFKPVTYYPVSATLNKEFDFNTNFITDNTKLSENEADDIINKCNSANEANVLTFDVKEIKKAPPLLFSLTELSKEANRLYSYKLDETLNIAQTLYEKYKVLSYPRSDSNYLADDSQSLVNSLLDIFSPDLKRNVVNAGKRVFDSSKLTDHHALIPFDMLPDNASIDEKNVFFLVLNRFLAAFSDYYIYSSTVATFDICGLNFKSVGKTDISLGWKSIYKIEEENDETSNLIPVLSVGEKVKIVSLFKTKKTTKPPGRYNDGSLVDEMKKLNLGTVATRAEIVKRLINTQYIFMDKKAFIPTPKGIEFIKLYNDSVIIDTNFVGELEKKLDNIWSQKLNYKDSFAFVEEIKEVVKNQIIALKNAKVTEGATFRSASEKQINFAKELAKKNNDKTFDKKNVSYDYINSFIQKYVKPSENGTNTKKEVVDTHVCLCKKKGSISEYDTYFKCSCNKVVFKNIAGVTLTLEQTINLFKGEEITVTGCKGSKGLFDAPVIMSKDGKPVFNFKKK